MDATLPDTADSLAWVKPYYTRAGEYWAPHGIEERERDRAATLPRLCGPPPKRVLELGAGTGETAAATADAGYDVTAIEFSPTRALHLRAHAQQRADQTVRGSLTALEADFYDVSLPGVFDVVCYWDGFGVGSDADQRRLLRHIASEWLAPGGSVLVDVFNPYRWAAEAGNELVFDRNHESHLYRQRRRFGFDFAAGCFLDEWCPIGDETGVCDESRAITQRIRCYNPADLRLLLEGTGLSLRATEGAGERDAWSYLALLTPAGANR